MHRLRVQEGGMNIERKTGKRAGGESTPGRGRGTGLVENRISSRFLAPVLCMIAAVGILLAIFTTGAEAADGNFGGGTGTVQNPYLIEDALDLQAMRNNLGRHYALANDIDASATKDWNGGEGFRPVGPGANDPFTGSLDGRGYEITGLYIRQSISTNTGLFGHVGRSGTIKNVGLVDVDVTGGSYVGGLVGWNDGSVSNSYSTGNVTGRQFVGGLIGWNDRSVSDSYATGNVSGDTTIGGLVGYNRGGSVSNSYSTGTRIGTFTKVGGLVGSNLGSVSSSFATGSVSGESFVGGLMGENRGLVSNAHYNIDEVLINGGHHVTIFGLYQDQYHDWYDSGMKLDIADYDSTLVPSGGHYEISGVNGLRDLLGFASDPGLEFCLVADIDVSSSPGFYIPLFSGGFDGKNHTIENLQIYQTFSYYVGLFGRVDGGSVSNVGLENVNITGSSNVGGLVGDNAGSVENCYVSGSVSGASQIGGLVGQNSWEGEGGSVSNSYAMGIVNGSRYYTGGLLGMNSGSVFNSYSTAVVSGNNYVGGLVGWNSRLVNNSYATGSVSGTEGYVGGLVGGNSGLVNNSYSTGFVNGSSQVGGLVGANSGSGSVENGFWDMETSGQTTSPGGTGKTTVEMKTKSTFINASWDFAHVWGMIEDITYPLLRWQDTEPPVAHAGRDQIVDQGTPVNLDGSASTDNAGIVNYTWTFHDGTGNVTLHGATQTHTFPVPGIYIVILNVTDVAGNWATDNLTVTVMDITPPVAHAGSDRIVAEGAVMAFDGSASTDNVGIANYTWTFHDGTEDRILYGVAPTHTFPVQGVCSVTLTVTDAAGNRDTDTLTVIVDATPPSAHAGLDQTVDEGGLATFDASTSTDNMGIVNYTWTFHDGTGNVTLYGVAPNHTFAVTGIYVITLTVTDVAGNRGTDTMTVVVDSTPPSAHAGPDRTVDEGARMTLDGSASTDNVGIVNYTWTFNDGTGDVILFEVSPDHPFPIPGVYTVTLLVSDIAGLNDTDTMTVTVLDITPPTAHAGPDRTVDEGTTMTFNGSVSTDNVGIVNYTWTFSYHGTEITLHGVSPVFRFWTQGTYHVTLVVRDAAGNDASDALVVHVSSGDTLPGDDDDGDDDDPSPFDFLFRKYGPLPLAGYAIIVGCLILLAFAGTGGSRGRSGQNNGEPGGSTAVSMPPVSPVLPVPSVQPVPPDQSVPPSPPSGFAPPSEEAPSPGTWYCPRCGQQLDGGYVFCLRCGQRKRG